MAIQGLSDRLQELKDMCTFIDVCYVDDESGEYWIADCGIPYYRVEKWAGMDLKLNHDEMVRFASRSNRPVDALIALARKVEKGEESGFLDYREL